MMKPRSISESTASYGTAVADIQHPLILQQEGQPLAVLISFEEYQRLRALVADEEQRRQAGWLTLEVLLKEVHQRPSNYTPEQIETEIGIARTEARRGRHVRRRSY